MLAGPDLHRAPSQYSIKCNDKNENQSELEAEHQSKSWRGEEEEERAIIRRQEAASVHVQRGQRTLN